MSEKTQLFPYRPTHKVRVVGCDASTTIEIALDPHEVRLLEEVSDLINETADDGCQPRLYLLEIM